MNSVSRGKRGFGPRSVLAAPIREVLAADRLVLGIGFGPFLAIDRNRIALPGEARDNTRSLIFTATAAYRFSPRWDARLS